jgi:hypothetical protein
MLRKEDIIQIFDIMKKSDFEIESINTDTSNAALPHTWYLRIRKKEQQIPCGTPWPEEKPDA